MSLEGKIRNRELLSIAKASDGRTEVEIIVEAVRQRKVSPPAHHGHGNGLQRRAGLPPAAKTAIRSASNPSGHTGRSTLDTLESQLRELKPVEGPQRLEIANAFALTVTAAQLMNVAKLPLVAAIRLNREHRLPA